MSTNDVSQPTLGVIGGSGLYDLEGLTDVREVPLTTPFGAPSDAYRVGRLGPTRLVFLPRHGRGHKVAPNEINFRANIHGMKQLGVQWIVSVSAVGSMKEEIRPGDLVVADQFVDRTRRPSTFFGDGVVGHVSMADPVCPNLAAQLTASAKAAGARVHEKGTYVVIDGPTFSTRAESRIYRSWGVDVIGMTNMPEAKLAREAEICYATLALATDYDCWHEAEEAVTVQAVLAVMKQNVAKAKATIQGVAQAGPPARTCPCATAAAHAIMTDRAAVPAAARERMQLLVGRYL